MLRYTTKGMTELLQSAGFVIEKVLDGNATIIIARKGD